MNSETLDHAWDGDDGLPRTLWDVVIVGSGYGGSMAAAGLAGCTKSDGTPLKVLLLERGRAWRPGEFPGSFAELPAHVRLGYQASGEVGGSPMGLIDVRPGADVNVMLANGLGGGSLINAGVLLEPRGVEPGTPLDAITRSLTTHGFYGRARRMLGGEVQVNGAFTANTINLHPGVDRQPLAKTLALRVIASHSGAAGAAPCGDVPITVAMSHRASSASVQLNQCTLCGDCMTGCNVGAKDSLDANLLAHAEASGVRMVTGTTVLRVAHQDEHGPFPPGASRGHWRLTVEHTDKRARARSPQKMQLNARRVVLAAGSLGSTEILLRSRSDILEFSHLLGQRFSCNGDNLAAARNLPASTDSSADEDLPLAARRVGPTITGSIEMPGGRGTRPFLLQEFSVPGAMRRLFDELVTTTESFHELAKPDLTRHGNEDEENKKSGRADAAPDPLAVDAEAMGRTLLIGTIGHDDAAGVLTLPAPAKRGGRVDEAAQPRGVRVFWPDARESRQINGAHEQAAERVALHPNATLLPNPLWRLLPQRLESLVSQPRGPVLTVHPLGGCAIGADVSKGVVDEYGRVYNASPEPGAWEGSLLVLDGAMVGGSLGANPSLTISALALRAIEQCKTDWQVTGGSFPGETQAAPPVTPRPKTPPRMPHAVEGGRADTRIELIERLVGPVTVTGRDGMQRDCIAELTLAFKPLSVRELSSTLHRTMSVDEGHLQSRVRLYDRATWESKDLRVLGDAQRRSWALAESPVRGTLDLLHRERSSAWRRRLRVILPWARNRGLRDIFQSVHAFLTGHPVEGDADALQRLHTLWDYASRAGERRLFDYQLCATGFKPGAQHSGSGWTPPVGPVEITGQKCLTYNCRANPWQQLTRMQLKCWGGRRMSASSVLVLDTRFLVGQGVPLLRIVGQRDQASALADLFCLGLYFARLILNIHLWTFRKPDDGPDVLPEPARLPGPIFLNTTDRLEPRLTELVTDRWGEDGKPVRIRLAHYPQPVDRSPEQKRPPLVMIHGYSVSGSTFTHPSLKPNAAEYFWRHGRDVWVVDLRTSAGLETATEPWALEDVGLVDIPAALTHISQVSAQQVDVLAHCIGCAMLSMALLSDAAEVRSGVLELGVNTWLTSEQLGVLAAFNGTRQGGPHPIVRRVVLSQKGPVLLYTDGNVFRAYLMQVLRRWLPLQGYQFRTPRPAGLSTQLLDRLLASLPYPAADYDTENPRWPCKTTPWTSTRHRMDLLYGRDFNAENLSDETLNAIDDLFGPMNLDTLAQVIHFTRFDTLTSQRGRGEFVTLGKLNTRWRGIRTLLLHGAENGLVDEATQRLLKRNLCAAGVEVEAPPPLPGVGHQDLLIGRGANVAFERIEAFLNRADGTTGSDGCTEAQNNPAIPSFTLELPWVGPRLDANFLVGKVGEVTASTIARPDRGLSLLVALPVQVQRNASGDVTHYTLEQNSPTAALAPDLEASGRWSTATLKRPTQNDKMHGWLVVHVHPEAETLLPLQPVPTVSPQPAVAIGLAPGGLNLHILFNAVGNWLPEQLIDNLTLAFVSRKDVERAYDLHQGQNLRLALGSCQYPAGLLDATCARAGLDLIAQRVDAKNDIDLALFVGDQIYADATAGVLDPTRRDEKYDQPNEAALRQRGMRAVLRRLPSLMLLDDHELVDNWEPLPDPGKLHPHTQPTSRPSWLSKLPDVREDWYPQPFSSLADEMQSSRRDGGRAYFRYQWMRGPHHRPRLPRDLATRCRGVPIYLADTRTGRDMRSPHGARPPHTLSISQRRALQAWLLSHQDEPKIVATPSRLLPRLSAVELARAASDAWDGYPESMAWLFRFLWRHQIRHTVFVSGDEHHSFAAEVCVSGDDGKKPLKIVCVHSSALYAPFAFANGDRAELEPNGQQDFQLRGIQVHCTTHWSPGDGWARLEIQPGQFPHVLVEFHKASTGDIALTKRLPLA